MDVDAGPRFAGSGLPLLPDCAIAAALLVVGVGK